MGQSYSSLMLQAMAESEQCSVCSHRQMQNILMSKKPRKNPTKLSKTNQRARSSPWPPSCAWISLGGNVTSFERKRCQWGL